MDATQKIREFIQANLVVFDDSVRLGDEDDIFELGYVDSPFAIKLVSFIEDEFHLEVKDDDLDILNFSSVARIAGFIREKTTLKEKDLGP